MKSNIILETLFFDFFYKNKVCVFVVKPNHRYERHYYTINSEKKIEIYDKNSESAANNPLVLGETETFDEKKTAVYCWKEGEKYARPLFDKVDYTTKTIDSLNDSRLVSLGRRLERYNNPVMSNKKSNQEWLMIILIIGMAFNLFITYKITEHLGMKLFG